MKDKFRIVTTISGRKVPVNPDTVEFIVEKPPKGASIQFSSGKSLNVDMTVEATLAILESK
jgi:uncharacterized protein YlzI (FlbEa/FlbD family)